MIAEHSKVYRVSLVIVLAMAVVFMPIDRAVSMSLVLGIALYYVYLRVLTHTVTAQLEAARQSRSAIPFGFFARMLVLALPLLIAAKFPQQLNILAAFAPLFICQIVGFVLYGWRGELA